jgi:mycothiol synthase
MSSFRRRPTRRDDAPGVAEVVTAMEAALLGSSDYTLGELEREWRELDVERDTWVVVDGDRVVGYGTAELDGGLGRTDGYVHPDVWGRGAGGMLVAELEEEVRRRGAVRVQNATLATDAAAQALLLGNGYATIRRFWQMRIVLQHEPKAASWPDGLTVSRFLAADLEHFHSALEDAFADHWNHRPEPLERFRHRFVEPLDFSPELWAVVRDGNEIVAGTVCEPDRMGAGWIGRLFTRAAWRGRGIGAALLSDAFAAFWQRGIQTVGLGVDAQSETGAQRLYERAGMHVHWAAVVFAKELE